MCQQQSHGNGGRSETSSRLAGRSGGEEQREQALDILDDFIAAELRFAIHSVNEGDRHLQATRINDLATRDTGDYLSNPVFHVRGPRDHLHLEHVTLRLTHRHQRPQDVLLVQSGQ